MAASKATKVKTIEKTTYRMTLTEPRRKFIVEAGRHMLNCGANLKMVSEMMCNLPEVMYGKGNIGDVYPFKVKPTHRTPKQCWEVTSDDVRGFDSRTRQLYEDMRHEEWKASNQDDLNG